MLGVWTHELRRDGCDGQQAFSLLASATARKHYTGSADENRLM